MQVPLTEYRVIQYIRVQEGVKVNERMMVSTWWKLQRRYSADLVSLKQCADCPNEQIRRSRWRKERAQEENVIHSSNRASPGESGRINWRHRSLLSTDRLHLCANMPTTIDWSKWSEKSITWASLMRTIKTEGPKTWRVGLTRGVWGRSCGLKSIFLLNTRTSVGGENS